MRCSMSRTDKLVRWLDDAERVLLAIVSRLGPWLSPVAPAYSVYLAAVEVLGWPEEVAFLMAVAVEVAGVSAFYLTLRLWSWNQENPGGPKAPAWVGYILIAVYLLVGIGVAVVIGLVPGLIPFIPASFFLLAGVGYMVLALMTDQARRETTAREGQEKTDKTQLDRRAFNAAVRERELSRAQANRALAEAGGDYLAALDLLPAGPSLASTDSGATADRIGDFDALLSIVSEQSGGVSFGAADVQRWLEVGRTRAYELVSYGQRVGDVRRVGRGEYRFNHSDSEGGVS